MVKDESSRRVIEDQLVKRIGTNATASYNFINTDMLKEANGDKFMDKLKQDNYNYVLMMRLADVEKRRHMCPEQPPAFMAVTAGFMDMERDVFEPRVLHN